MQIQGSGRVRLTDGSWVRLGYAGKNGHCYTSIGKLLAERVEQRPEDLTMDGLKSWLRADPARGRALMQRMRPMSSSANCRRHKRAKVRSARKA